MTEYNICLTIKTGLNFTNSKSQYIKPNFQAIQNLTYPHIYIFLYLWKVYWKYITSNHAS